MRSADREICRAQIRKVSPAFGYLALPAATDRGDEGMARFTATLAALAAVTIANPAMAVTTIDFTNITAQWFDVAGGTNVNFTGSNTSNAAVFWGSGGNQSGYRFQAVALPQLIVDPLTNTSAVTNIGQFTHYNLPINAGTSITGLKLKFTSDVLVNGGLFGTVNFIYAFNHFETPNGSDPCANGGANDTGININGCADRVSVNFNQNSGAFSIGNVDYALDVRGFLVNSTPAQLFWTQEDATNLAYVRGQVVLRSTAGNDGVPEPSTWATMIVGMGAVGAMMRRRRRAGDTTALAF